MSGLPRIYAGPDIFDLLYHHSYCALSVIVSFVL